MEILHTRHKTCKINKAKIQVSLFHSFLFYSKDSEESSKHWQIRRLTPNVQATEIGLVRKVHGVTLRDKVRNSEIRETLCSAISQNREISATLVRPHDQNGPLNFVETSSARYTHGKTSQRSTKKWMNEKRVRKWTNEKNLNEVFDSISLTWCHEFTIREMLGILYIKPGNGKSKGSLIPGNSHNRGPNFQTLAVSFQGISQAGSTFMTLRWFTLAHIFKKFVSAKVAQLNQSANLFDRKLISRYCKNAQP